VQTADICVLHFRRKIRRQETTWGLGHRWFDNIKVRLSETECEHVDWSKVAQFMIQSYRWLTGCSGQPSIYPNTKETADVKCLSMFNAVF